MGLSKYQGLAWEAKPWKTRNICRYCSSWE